MIIHLIQILKSLYGVADFTYDPYTGNGRYDHGHICPSADERQVSAVSNKQTFYFTNMQPQYSTFNQNKGIMVLKWRDRT